MESCYAPKAAMYQKLLCERKPMTTRHQVEPNGHVNIKRHKWATSCMNGVVTSAKQLQNANGKSKQQLQPNPATNLSYTTMKSQKIQALRSQDAKLRARDIFELHRLYNIPVVHNVNRSCNYELTNHKPWQNSKPALPQKKRKKPTSH